jgi:signal transduction histidine kinase
MAQGALTRPAAGAGILALGAAAEAVAPAATPFATTLDWAVGAALGGGGAWLLDRAPAAGRLALLAAVTWYLGTLAGTSSGVLAAVCVLAYRGPLLHLLLSVPSGRLPGARARALATAAWIAGLLGPVVAAPATAAFAATVAAVVLARARRSAPGRRQALLATAAAAAGLSAMWWLAALDLASHATLLVLNDVAVLGAGVVALAACAGAWERQAAGKLVVELGADRRPDRPVTAQLARALGDPDLELRYAVPDVGWLDERGHAVPAPDGDAVTRAIVPGGGEVALLHGAVGPGDLRLAASAAAAAALALDSARLEAAVHTHAADVRASRRRLLTAADAERRALEQRLSDGPLAGLRRVDRLLDGFHGTVTGELRDELRAATAELSDLGRGLYPPALTRADLSGALEEMARRSPVPTTLHILGDLQILTDELRATTWFVCSEALANVARHALARHATVTIQVNSTTLLIEIRDDGHGRATPTRGLRGLADRIEALTGTFTVDSPAGGPTTIRACLPI